MDEFSEFSCLCCSPRRCVQRALLTYRSTSGGIYPSLWAGEPLYYNSSVTPIVHLFGTMGLGEVKISYSRNVTLQGGIQEEVSCIYEVTMTGIPNLYGLPALLVTAREASQSEMVQKEKSGPPPPPTKSSKKKHEKWGRDSKQTFSHPWLLTSLKGHTGSVLDMDFSSNGKFLATCAEDRAVLLWSTKDWNQKEHKSTRINVEFDHATFVRWSPDSKAFIIHKAMENEIDVYKINKRADGWISSATKHLTYPKYHDSEIVGLGIACNGKFIMSCSGKTDLVLLDLKGQLLAKVDTYLMNTFRARVSPCGRFIAASGFTADVKIWEVTFTKSGEFNAVSRAFELTGHSAGVYDFAFNADSSCMATVSKDGTWKVFNTKIEFHKGEDPHLLVTGKYDSSSGKPVHIALSPNGEVVTIAVGSMLLFYSVLSGELDAKIEDVYSGSITCVQFDAGGKFLLTAGEKHVRVFHNVTGYRVSIVSTRAKLRKSGLSSAQKDRMEQQIKEAQGFLQALGEHFE